MNRYLHPATYAALANQTLAEATGPLKGQVLRTFNREVRKGLEAAVALALDVPGVYVNPYHPGLTDDQRQAMHAAGM